MDDIRLTANQVANAVGISGIRVENILDKPLGMWKVSAWWVPWLLTPDQKRIRLAMSQTNVAIFEADPASFLELFLTQDKCCVHHSEPETKRHLCSGNTHLLPLQRRPMWCHRQDRWCPPSYGMQKCIVYIDYLQQGQTINGKHYNMPICWGSCKRQSIQNGLGKLTKRVQDNAPAPKFMAAMAVRDCCLQLVDHFPYFPYCTQSDWVMLTKWHTWLESSTGPMTKLYLHAAEDFFEDQDENFYTTGTKTVCGPQGRLCWKMHHFGSNWTI